MRTTNRWIAGVGIGAGTMYFFDPRQGNRRRAVVSDQLIAWNRRTTRFLRAAFEDLGHRFKGLMLESKERLLRRPVDDDVLTERVRERIGRAVTHPSSILVNAQKGEVTLRGPILAREVEALLKQVRSARGVRNIRHELEVHEEPGNVSGLQGEPSSRPKDRPELLQDNWLPGTRLLVGIAGGALVANAFRRRDSLNGGLGILGSMALLRAFTNLPVRRALRN